ncbi:hypothetical protein [Holospora undulata]|uniref:Uncharacterized protein n=1 Tax=Holospora undulata HU1 TaxID=1321371 RepID=A0A061JGQ7_9PROT|nr:hypothetical protein [Holospora undulata]ETZ05250.1 hypothetical protein K737_300316 [Holospora undulata HU1]
MKSLLLFFFLVSSQVFSNREESIKYLENFLSKKDENRFSDHHYELVFEHLTNLYKNKAGNFVPFLSLKDEEKSIIQDVLGNAQNYISTKKTIEKIIDVLNKRCNGVKKNSEELAAHFQAIDCLDNKRHWVTEISENGALFLQYSKFKGGIEKIEDGSKLIWNAFNHLSKQGVNIRGIFDEIPKQELDFLMKALNSKDNSQDHYIDLDYETIKDSLLSKMFIDDPKMFLFYLNTTNLKFEDLPKGFHKQLRESPHCYFEKTLEKILNPLNLDDNQYKSFLHLLSVQLDRVHMSDCEKFHFYGTNNESKNLRNLCNKEFNESYHDVKMMLSALPYDKKINLLEKSILNTSSVKACAHFLDMTGIPFEHISQQSQTKIKQLLPNALLNKDLYSVLKFEELFKQSFQNLPFSREERRWGCFRGMFNGLFEGSKELEESLSFFNMNFNQDMEVVARCVMVFRPEKYSQYLEDLENFKLRNFLKTEDELKSEKFSIAQKNLKKIFEEESNKKIDFSKQIMNFIDKIAFASSLDVFQLLMENTSNNNSKEEDYEEVRSLVAKMVYMDTEKRSILRQKINDFGSAYTDFKNKTSDKDLFSFFKSEKKYTNNTRSNLFFQYLRNRNEDLGKCKKGENVLIQVFGFNYFALLGKFNHSAMTEQIEADLVRRKNNEFIANWIENRYYEVYNGAVKNPFCSEKLSLCIENYKNSPEYKKDLALFNPYSRLKGILERAADKELTNEEEFKREFLKDITKNILEINEPKIKKAEYDLEIKRLSANKNNPVF